MKCEVCHETELEGDPDGFDEEAEDSALVMAILAPSPRNYLICASCNKAVCKNCCSHAKSGYCDGCIDRYNLLDEVEEIQAGYP